MKIQRYISKIVFNKKFLIITNIGLVFLVIILFIFINTKHPNKNIILRDKDNIFKLTNPILDCEYIDQENETTLSYVNVNDKVNSLKDKYGVNDVSLYFRDLNNGPWIGINEKATFSPASLLKTPVVMALFKYAETKPEILNKQIFIKESDIVKNSNQNIVFPGLVKNTNYTLFNIAESVIENSDNAGVGIILNNIPVNYISNVFNSIGVPYKDTTDEVNLRVKDYASFFRVLFNSSYLSREMSEKVLEILSKSKYKDGIVAGVPSGVTVAHKFGERVVDDTYQLHDCGIVYYPNNPYILCIMTKGDNFIRQQGIIQELSRYIYTEVDTKNNYLNK